MDAGTWVGKRWLTAASQPFAPQPQASPCPLPQVTAPGRQASGRVCSTPPSVSFSGPPATRARSRSFHIFSSSCEGAVPMRPASNDDGVRTAARLSRDFRVAGKQHSWQLRRLQGAPRNQGRPSGSGAAPRAPSSGSALTRVDEPGEAHAGDVAGGAVDPLKVPDRPAGRRSTHGRRPVGACSAGRACKCL